MLANNETGVVQPLDESAARGATRRCAGAHRRGGGVQLARRCEFGGRRRPDLGERAQVRRAQGGRRARRARRVAHLAPQLLGGGQERERRSGTHNVAGIVAMAAAAVAAVRERDAVVARVGAWRDELARELLAVGDVEVTAPDAPAYRRDAARAGGRGRERGAGHRARRSRRRARRRAPPVPAERSSPATCSPLWASIARRRVARCVCRWAGRRRDADIDGRDHGVAQGDRDRCGARDESARRDVGRRRQLGHRCAAARGRPRSRRRHDEVVGRSVGPGLLLGGRCRRRPPRVPSARHRPPRLQLQRGLRRQRRRAVHRLRTTHGADTEPVHRMQPAPQVRPVSCVAPINSDSMRSPRVTTPAS